MTEDEAKTKTCPTISYCINEVDVIQDARAPLYAQSNCLGSECMAWRFRTEWLDIAQQDPDWVAYSPYAHDGDPANVRQNGYCGLAGAPA